MKKLAPWFIGLCLIGSRESARTYRRTEIEMTVLWVTDCGSWDKRRSKSKIVGQLLATWQNRCIRSATTFHESITFLRK